MHDICATAALMVGNGRGILAADESVGTVNTRLEAASVAASEEQRRDYREMLVATPQLSQWISGVILSDDIFRSPVSDGRSFPDYCKQAGLLPGVKVDTGAKPLAAAPDETITEGLDDLRARLAAYERQGAAFTKWRAVIHIGDGLPSHRALSANAHALARYAALAQEAGLVPIVEPEVLMDGDHSIDRCASVTDLTLQIVFGELREQGVLLEGIVLKPNMVVPGANCLEQVSAEAVASATLQVLRRTVPAAVPGIAFLSGGQSAEVATAHLAALNAVGTHPWQLTFSFGRALVDPALQAWRGNPECVPAGQHALATRARANAEAAAA
jgi:fructose-bisphosphate aldolase, class I